MMHIGPKFWISSNSMIGGLNDESLTNTGLKLSFVPLSTPYKTMLSITAMVAALYFLSQPTTYCPGRSTTRWHRARLPPSQLTLPRNAGVCASCSFLTNARYRGTSSEASSPLLSVLLARFLAFSCPWRHTPAFKILLGWYQTDHVPQDDSNSEVWLPIRRFFELREAGRAELGSPCTPYGRNEESIPILTMTGSRTADGYEYRTHTSLTSHLPHLLRMVGPFSESLTSYVHMHVLGRWLILIHTKATRRQNDTFPSPSNRGNVLRGPAEPHL
ncbi:hypothetical protein V8E53_007666 [Lactarius tabidus]